MTGDLGESLANVFLSRRTPEGHLFRTKMVGGKWPSIDIYAEILSSANPVMFCFFQVKTTSRGYTKRERDLKINMDVRSLFKFSSYCAPSYLIGIDHDPLHPLHSKAFIATIRGNQTKSLSSLPTIYPLNEQNLIALRDEIVAFWNNLNPLKNKENYLTNFAI